MIVKINKRGRSFKGVTAYLMHDKKRSSAERVEWSNTGNMHTNDIDKAAKVMAWTDINADLIKATNGGQLTGSKASAGAVYHYSLSWAHGEQPSKEHQQKQALETLERLGLIDHQYYMVSHSDTDHNHIHIVANLVNQETGRSKTPSFDKKELQKWALEYERKYTLHCEKREENAKKRGEGEHVKHQDKRQYYAAKVTAAYQASDNGRTFATALKIEGLTLASGRRGGFVLVDEYGDIQKLARNIDGVKTKDIKAKLSDLENKELPDAEELATERQSFDRDQYEAKQQEALAEAAENAARERALEKIKAKRSALKNEQIRQQKTKLEEQKAEKKKAQESRANYQKYIDKKTKESREKWNIEELTKERDIAADHLHNNSGFWARLTFKTSRAQEALEAAKLTLKEREGRFKADIEAFNKNRPQWAVNKELEKQGLEVEKAKTITVEKEQPQAAKLQRDMSAAELEEHKQGLLKEMQPEVPEEQIEPQKLQRDMSAEELADYKAKLIEEMQQEPEQDRGQDMEID